MQITQQTPTVLHIKIYRKLALSAEFILFIFFFIWLGLVICLRQNNPWYVYILGGISILSGSAMILYLSLIKIPASCVFDKPSGKVYITQNNLFKSEVKVRRLGEIKRAKVIEDIDDGYSINLILLEFEQITLQTRKSKGNYDEIAQSINQFLGVKS